MTTTFSKSREFSRQIHDLIPCGAHTYSTTPSDSGIPSVVRHFSVMFSYNDFASVEALLRDEDHDIACLIMEPVKFDPPRDDFLHKVADLCKKRGVVFILDEMVSGFKWSPQGASLILASRPTSRLGGKVSRTASRLAHWSGARKSWSWAVFAKKAATSSF